MQPFNRARCSLRRRLEPANGRRMLWAADPVGRECRRGVDREAGTERAYFGKHAVSYGTVTKNHKQTFPRPEKLKTGNSNTEAKRLINDLESRVSTLKSPKWKH